MKKTPIVLTFKRAEMPERLAKTWLAAQNATKARNAAASNELLIYDVIGYDWWTGGGITPDTVSAFLDGLPKDTTEIIVRVNSPGGSVFDGIAIYNLLVNSGKRVLIVVDALAASVASVVCMAGDEIKMAGNAQMMIHKAWSFAVGNADDFEKEAAALKSIDGSLVSTYAARTGQTDEAIGKMMADETWLNAEAAKEKGFCDAIEPLKTAPEKDKEEAKAQLKAQLKAGAMTPEEARAIEALEQKVAKDAKESQQRKNTILRQRTELLKRQAEVMAA